MAKKKEQGRFQGHCACPKCGSDDNGAYYLHEDGSHSFHCFGVDCKHTIQEFDTTTMKSATFTPVAARAREGLSAGTLSL